VVVVSSHVGFLPDLLGHSVRSLRSGAPPRKCWETAVGTWTLVSVLWIWSGQGCERGVEHPFSRPWRSRSGSLRINVPRNQRFLVCRRIAVRFVNACGNCAPCGYVCISKARR